jgi:methylated-DNA-[protein]-cysteine S-methyltransferase
MARKDFSESVWELVKKIPKGKVTTYRAIAIELNTRAFRAVGGALKCNPYSPRVPCHRVVKSDGSIGGFQGGIDPKSSRVKKKISMLRKEGIRIKDCKLCDFKRVLFEDF